MFHYESMDNSSQVFSEEQRQQINKEMGDILIAALDNNQITVAESEECADFVLQNFNEVTSKETLLIFLKDLSALWPAYKNYYLKQKGEEEAIDDQAKITEIQSDLDNLKINQTN